MAAAAPHSKPGPIGGLGSEAERERLSSAPAAATRQRSSLAPPPSASRKFSGLSDSELQRNFSAGARSRRTSLPASSNSFLQSKAQSNIGEASGLITDMLATKDLPGQVVSCLKVVNQLLNPSESNVRLHVELGLPEVVQNPFSGERIRVAGGAKQRHGALTWSTVTSATGLTTIEAEPSRTRSSSFWQSDAPGDDEAPHSPAPDVLKSAVAPAAASQVFRAARDGFLFDVEALEAEPEWRGLSRWDFPLFEVAETYPDSILTRLAYRAFAARGLFDIFKIPRQKFFNFMHALELGYWDIPYHNRIHASDVLHAVFYLTQHPVEGVIKDGGPTAIWRVLSPLEQMALFVAAAMHDYDHPGRTNAFLVATQDPKAILYNDRSVLENHHAASAWRLLQDPENNFLPELDAAEMKCFRYLVIELILATDLKRHFEIIADFGAKVNSSEGLDWEAEGDRLLVSQMLIKLGDISAPTKPFPLHSEWTSRVTREFYTQGDAEKLLGMPVSLYMDRDEGQVPKLQDSFISVLVSPLAHAVADSGLFPTSGEAEEGSGEAQTALIANLLSNRAYWKEQLPPEEAAEPAPAPAASEAAKKCCNADRTDPDGEMGVIEEREDEEDL